MVRGAEVNRRYGTSAFQSLKGYTAGQGLLHPPSVRSRMALHDPARLSPISAALREAYRAEENACVAERMTQAGGASAKHEEAKAIAVHLIEEAQAQGERDRRLPAPIRPRYRGGCALMCLAEAPLRVPDAATADALIRDKIGDITGPSTWARVPRPSSMRRLR